MSKPIYYCVGCGTTHSKSAFYQSPREEHKNGMAPFCKNFMYKYVYGSSREKDRVDENFSLSKFQSLLMQVNRPFIYSVYEGSIGSPQETIGRYFSIMNSNSSYINLEWADSDFGDYKASQPKPYKEKTEADVTEAMVDDWGRGYTPEQYHRLEALYQKLSDEYQIGEGIVNEMTLRNAIKAQVKLEETISTGRASDIKGMTETTTKMFKSLDIKPNVSAGDGFDNIGELIKAWEQEKPVPEPLEEEGMGDYIVKYFLSPMLEQFGKPNPFQKQYEEVKQEYGIKDYDEVLKENEDRID